MEKSTKVYGGIVLILIILAALTGSQTFAGALGIFLLFLMYKKGKAMKKKREEKEG